MLPSPAPQPDRDGLSAADGRERVALVLGGGNALGAYLAGAYETLHERGPRPDRIVGASIGAVTGAILAGNPPERRLERLQEFWAEAALHTREAAPGHARLRQAYNGVHVALAAALGRPTIFGRRYPGLWSVLPGIPGDVALYDHAPLRRTLERLVDFDRLNRADAVRLTIACTDLETGGDVYFDNARGGIRPEHVLASAAIAPLFPPVEIDGRLLCDPGYANNLPLDPVFDPRPGEDLVCLAVDLFGLRSPRPETLDAALERAQDIVFASAGRRRVEGLRREYGLLEEFRPEGPRVRLVHLAYRAAGHELAAKTLDFSPSSLRDRWAAGRRDMAAGLALLEGADGGRRFEYLAVDPREAGAAAGDGPALDRAA
jgi:NTE family protein